jgi:nitrile hydratase subunit beta
MAILKADMVPTVVRTGASTKHTDQAIPARFNHGDRVVARNMNPIGHTRLPRYVRSKRGVIHHDHGVFVFPDTSAHGKGPKPQHVYNVRFESAELWGPSADKSVSLYIDLWEDYLDPA